jgi:uncharacterized protein
MKNAVLIHGCPDREEFMSGITMSQQHWFPWLKDKLTEQGVMVFTPEMPVPYDPVYEAWRDVFEQYEITEDTLLVGHSCGGGFILRWLSEHPSIRTEKVVLIVPWLDPGRTLSTNFFDFTIDSELSNRTKGISVLYSTDDTVDVIQSIQKLKTELPTAHYIEFTDKGHFTYEDLKTTEFPQVLSILET